MLAQLINRNHEDRRPRENDAVAVVIGQALLERNDSLFENEIGGSAGPVEGSALRAFNCALAAAHVTPGFRRAMTP